jgi:D-glycero-D-manno-heptose 1,7-bisphosphate phosphatase
MEKPSKGTMRRSFADGRLYAMACDGQLAGLHRLVAESIPEGSSLLDVCCGTGSFARIAASRCRDVVGIDISEAMIRWADERRRQSSLEHVRFVQGDASDLSGFAKGTFDWATATMALHEMSAPLRGRVLAEMLRVAGQAIVVDFAAPMPWNLKGIRNRLIEMLAGPRHFREFRDYLHRGGLTKYSRTRKGMKKRRAVFLDLHGTLVLPLRPESFGEMTLIPGADDAIKRLLAFGFVCPVVTVQSRIEKGLFTEVEFRAWFVHFFDRLDLDVKGPYICPHSYNQPCPCEKPNLLLYQQAAQELSLDLCRSFTIGDSPEDVEAARRFGGLGCRVRTGWEAQAISLEETGASPAFIGDTITDVVEWILNREEKTPIS